MQPSQNAVRELAARFNLKLLVYFGSFLTANFRPHSDIDIAFLADRPLSSMEKWDLCKELIIFHRKSEIDLVDLQTAEPILRYVVANEGKLLFEREEGLFDRYALFYIKRFYELRPLIREQMRRTVAEIKELELDGD